jgi:hypothetical protein
MTEPTDDRDAFALLEALTEEVKRMAAKLTFYQVLAETREKRIAELEAFLAPLHRIAKDDDNWNELNAFPEGSANEAIAATFDGPFGELDACNDEDLP